MGFCNIGAGQASLNFCSLSCTFVFQSAAVTGGRFSNSMPAQSPVRCMQYGVKTSKNSSEKSQIQSSIFNSNYTLYSWEFNWNKLN